MRIAITNYSQRKIGGAESYVENLLLALHNRGHQVCLWSEMDEPLDFTPIAIPPGVVQWNAKALGMDQALGELRLWKPDVIFAQGYGDPKTEEGILDLGFPTSLFLHNYYGSCVSGTKAFSFPNHKPCKEIFGLGCFLHYYPRRCGGLNPFTAWKLYKIQRERRDLFHRYRTLVVASKYMAQEFRKFSEKTHVLPLWVNPSPRATEPEEGTEFRLLFIGRLEEIKGGRVLIEALPLIAERLQDKVSCHFAGLGGARNAWESRATHLCNEHPNVKIRFHGWVDRQERDKLMQHAHLLVLPSLWPEPFGLVGLEAGAQGIPTVAFDVGGISEWLENGVNGVLAGPELTATRLADAVVAALSDRLRYKSLREGAVRVSRERFSLERHLESLEKVL